MRLQELAQRSLEDEETPDRIFAFDRDIFQEPLNPTQTGMSLELDSRSISEKRNNQALCPPICTFFNLPGAIRNLIYSHLLAANYIGLSLIDPRPDSRATGVKDQNGRSERTNILLASRRAHHEALPFLFRESRFGVLIDLRCLAARSLSNTAINMMQNVHIVIDMRVFGTGAIESQSEEPSYKMRILNHLGGLNSLNIKRKSCRITLRISDFECWTPEQVVLGLKHLTQFEELKVDIQWYECTLTNVLPTVRYLNEVAGLLKKALGPSERKTFNGHSYQEFRPLEHSEKLLLDRQN